MRTKKLTAGLAVAIGLLALGACGTKVAGSADSAGVASVVTPGEAMRAGAANSVNSYAGAADLQKLDVAALPGRAPSSPPVTRRSLIYTGEVALTSDDVAAAAAKVHAVAVKYAGRIDDERARASHGKVTSEMLTVRVPSGRFTAALEDIKGLGTLRSATSSADDVTTQVIDVKVRLRAQRASLRRIEQLMSRASTLGQVIALESQLTRRQADLDSLEQKQAYLRDQTTMSTISVDIERKHHAAAVTKPVHHRTGFIGGLHHGWHALVVTLTALAAGLGAALPFGVPLLVLAVPAWLVLRRRRRSRAQGVVAAAPTT